MSDKFIQPLEGITVVSKANRGTLLTEEILQIGRDRVATGEPIEEVALDLAIYETALLGDLIKNETVLRTAQHPEGPLHALADSFEAQLRDVAIKAFIAGRKSIDENKLRAADTISEAEAATARAPYAVREYLREHLEPLLVEIMDQAGQSSQATARMAAAPHYRTAASKLTYKKQAQRTKEWAERHAGSLIDDLTKTTKKRIREAIVKGLEAGPLRVAYDAILQAVGDESRAESIARTETMRAVNFGQRAMWEDAVASGELDKNVRRVWLYTDDVLACGECEDLDGETATLSGNYPDGIDGPPLHPRCRCTEALLEP